MGLVLARRVRAHQKRRAELLSGMRQLGDEYPEPTDSPGSQTGCCGEAMPPALVGAATFEVEQEEERFRGPR